MRRGPRCQRCDRTKEPDLGQGGPSTETGELESNLGRGEGGKCLKGSRNGVYKDPEAERSWKGRGYKSAWQGQSDRKRGNKRWGQQRGRIWVFT